MTHKKPAATGVHKYCRCVLALPLLPGHEQCWVNYFLKVI